MKFLPFFLIFVLFAINIVNVIDKATTYIAMQSGGFIELNQRASYFFTNYGVLATVIFQTLLLLGSSILIYVGIKKLSEKIKHIQYIVVVPALFMMGIYVEAVVNNIRWLI